MSTVTTPRRRSELAERNQRRAGAAAGSGRLSTLAAALLGPSSPPAGSRPDADSVQAGAPLYEFRGSVFGLPAYVGLVGSDPAILDEARERLDDLARRWAPAGARSELARLRATPGVTLRVSADTLLLAGLLAAPTVVPGNRRDPGFWVDTRHGTAGLLGNGPWPVTSTAAALATDLVVADMIEAGAAGACVRIGGAMRVEGIGPRRAGWLTTAPPGRGGRTGAVLRLRQGAMVTGHATSSTGTGPAAVGAIADQAWRAEALVAAALAAPMPRARALVAGVATAGCLVGPDGRTVTVGRWADFAV